MTHWTIDRTHSEVNFKVKHLAVSTVTGHFASYDASIESASDDFSDAKITFEADVASITTNNEQRDGHLTSPDFFDAAAHPRMTFRSTSVKKTAADRLQVTGDLTIRGTTRPITLEVVYNGTVAGLSGTTVAGFEIRGKVNRFDYGLHWNALTEAGSLIVSSDVRIEILAEFNRVRSAAQAA